MKNGFTLAEVLITLAVIGVVAVLTVPNLMKSYQKQVTVTQLQKFYNQLRTAATNCMQEEMSDTLIGTTADRDPQAFIKKYLKPTSFFTDYTEGFGETYGWVDTPDETKTPMIDNLVGFCAKGGICATLETGASIAIGLGPEFMSVSEDDSKRRFEDDDAHGFDSIFIDVNGKKGPNVSGRDLFYIRLYSDGVVGNAYLPEPRYSNKEACIKNRTQYGNASCFDYIKKNGWVMDY